MSGKPLPLRPHHGMCMAYFVGLGYSGGFSAHMAELLEELNALGIGPQGFGGKITCLNVAIETAPTHVAGLPVAVNVSCHATRRAAEIL